MRTSLLLAMFIVWNFQLFRTVHRIFTAEYPRVTREVISKRRDALDFIITFILIWMVASALGWI